MIYYQTPNVSLHLGHVLEELGELPDHSVHMICTSPPYFQLRDYGVEPTLWGGDPDCNHDWKHGEVKDSHYDYGTSTIRGSGKKQQQASSFCVPYRLCVNCGAFEGQLGMEPTVSLFSRDIVLVFREIKRVLRSDGSLWLNVGDGFNDGSVKECKPKDLLGVPWTLALALRDDGWFLRRDIIFAKGMSFNLQSVGSIMPESAKDRPTTSHEYIFLLTPSSQYYYNYEDGMEPGPYGVHNLRSVWFIPLDGNSTHHTATFPERLPEICIRLSTSPGDLVLDPFMGSGTVGVVAKKMGRRFVGIDAVEEFVDLARDQITGLRAIQTELWEG